MAFLVSIGYEGNSCAFVFHGEARRWSKFCGGRSNDMSERVRPVVDVKEGLDSARGSLSFRPFRIIATFLVKADTVTISRIWRVSSSENSLRDVDRRSSSFGSLGSICFSL
eukprot:scaffold5580_cov51-Attheya_sp.AAC.2